MTPVLTFRDCGFAGRELAQLGEFVIGSVEPAAFATMRALWSFYPETRRKLTCQPAGSVEDARRLVEEQTNAMLRAMGILARDNAGVRVVIVPAARERRTARAAGKRT